MGVHYIQNNASNILFLPLIPDFKCLHPWPCCAASILLNLQRIPLRPLAHQLAHNLAARQLGHGVDKGHAAEEALVLGDALGEPVLDVLRGDAALGGVLNGDVCSWVFFVGAVFCY